MLYGPVNPVQRPKTAIVFKCPKTMIQPRKLSIFSVLR